MLVYIRTCTCHSYTQWNAAYLTNCMDQFKKIYTSLTGPSKVENVTFGSTSVENNKICQQLSWNTVQLRHYQLQSYIIRYSQSPAITSQQAARGNEQETVNKAFALKLQVPTSNTTVTVWVAARTVDNYTGDFSDPRNISYTSTSQTFHRCDKDRPQTVLPLSSHITHCSPWSPQRPNER